MKREEFRTLLFWEGGGGRGGVKREEFICLFLLLMNPDVGCFVDSCGLEL